MDFRCVIIEKELYSIMQQNDRYFTFLISHSFRSRIFFKRISISKKVLQNGALASAAVIAISTLSIGLIGVFGNSISFDKTFASVSGISPASQLATAASLPNTIDYSRPQPTDVVTMNSGGPMQEDGSEMEDAAITDQLKVIQTTSNPAYLPSMWVHLGKINNEFGFRRNPFGGRTYEFHAGMDIDGERGDIVVAPANGVVTKAGYLGGYGNMIEVDHGNGLATRYGHLSKIDVEVGDTVSRGQLIAFIGSTGRSTGPHLHYELRLNDRPINPRHFLPQEPTSVAGLN